MSKETFVVLTEGPKGPRGGRGIKREFVVIAESDDQARAMALAEANDEGGTVVRCERVERIKRVSVF